MYFDTKEFFISFKIRVNIVIVTKNQVVVPKKFHKKVAYLIYMYYVLE